MSTKKIVLIDYGLGNLLSVGRALEAAGAQVKVSSSPHEIENADRVLFPGVGAFGAGMEGLASIGLIDSLKKFGTTERPLLGICLGMQMLMSQSEEFGSFAGLDLIPGGVKKLPETDEAGNPLRIPHIGWTKAQSAHLFESQMPWKSAAEKFFYFVHSYYVEPTNADHVALTLRFADRKIPVGIQRGAILGVQFHPEKSGESGLEFLRNFLATT